MGRLIDLAPGMTFTFDDGRPRSVLCCVPDGVWVWGPGGPTLFTCCDLITVWGAHAPPMPKGGK